MTKIKKGKVMMFRNDYAYPSLTKKIVTVVDVWKGEDFVSVKFDNGFRMAVKKSELT